MSRKRIVSLAAVGGFAMIAAGLLIAGCSNSSPSSGPPKLVAAPGMKTVVLNVQGMH